MNSRFLLTSSIGTLLAYSSTGVLVTLLPTYAAEEMKLEASGIGVVVFLGALAAAVGRTAAGVTLSHVEPSRIVVVCVAVAAAVTVLPALWPSPVALSLTKIVTGAALAIFHTAIFLVAVRAESGDDRGRALAWVSIPIFVGSAFGPALGDVLMAWTSPRVAWFPAAGLMLVAVLVVTVPLHARPPSPSPPPTGAVPVEAVTSAGVPADAVTPPAARGPFRFRMVFDPIAAVPTVVFVLMVFSWGSFSTFAPLYAPTVGMANSGIVFFCYSAVVIVMRLYGVRLFRRFSLVTTVIVGLVANVVASLVGALARNQTGLLVSTVLLAVGVGLVYTTLLEIALRDGPPGRDTTIVSTYGLSYDIGLMVAAPASGWLIAATGGDYGSFHTLGVATGTAALVLFLVRYLRRPTRSPAAKA